MNPLLELHEHGQSYWLDNLTRRMLDDGGLARRVGEEGLRGVTSNPKTFADSLTGGDDYHAEIHRLAADGESAEDIHRKLMVSDVSRACDVLQPVFEESGGSDGFVSIEVDPRLARKAGPSLQAARMLWREVGRPNCMVKIPGTMEGLQAIEAALAEGIRVNVTLLFSPERYAKVQAAYVAAQRTREARGESLDGIDSVASFFLSRIDVLVDECLAERDEGNDSSLRGEVALALARKVYGQFRDLLEDPEWISLGNRGARPQRPLWASTGRKNSNYSETMYVDALVARDTVNTMPESTIKAFREGGQVENDAIFQRTREPDEVLELLSGLGIEIGDVADQLEEEGIRKFVDPHMKALDAIDGIMGDRKRE
jgi:transaldolase